MTSTLQNETFSQRNRKKQCETKKDKRGQQQRWRDGKTQIKRTNQKEPMNEEDRTRERTKAGVGEIKRERTENKTTNDTASGQTN